MALSWVYQGRKKRLGGGCGEMEEVFRYHPQEKQSPWRDGSRWGPLQQVCKEWVAQREGGEQPEIPTWSHGSPVGFFLSVSPDPEMHTLLNGTVLVLIHTVSRVSAIFPLPLSTHQICPFWNQERHSSLGENSSMTLLFTCVLHT